MAGNWPVRFLLLAVLVGLGVWYIHHAYPPQGPVDPAVVSLVIPSLHAGVTPEPAETFTYVAVAAMAPLLVWAATSRAFAVHRLWLAELAAAALFLWPLIRGEVASVLVHGAAPVVHVPVRTWVVCVGIGAALCFLPNFLRARRGVYVFLIGLLVLDVSCWRLLGTTVPDTDLHWASHADPVLYAIAQVHGGKTLLVDMPSQYGLYAEFIAPLFRVLPLNLVTIGLLFALLQVVASGALIWVMAQRLRSAVLLALAGMALIMLTAENILMLANMRELYLQYWPIRYLWPALSVLAFHWYLQKPDVRRAAAFGVLSGVAVLWNADTGVVVELAFAGYLLARIVVTPGRRARAIHLAAHIGSTVAAMAIVLLLMRVSGGRLHLQWLWEYQKLFAGMGLMALPMPHTPHDWMATIGLYLLALFIAAEGWSQGARDRADLLFYLGLLGIGLFAYYVSRSHPFNLMMVMWPSLLMVALLCDSIVARFRRTRRYVPGIVLSIVGTASLALCAVTLLLQEPKFLQAGYKELRNFGAPGASLFDQDIALLRRHLKPGDRCVIAAYRQGVYHLATNTSSSISGPALSEAVLVRDRQYFIDQVLAGTQPCLFFGAGRSSAALPLQLDQLKQHYRVIDQTPEGDLLFMRPLSAPAVGAPKLN